MQAVPAQRHAVKSSEPIAHWFVHCVSILITIVLTIFACDGAIVVWPTHPYEAMALAILCNCIACFGHVRFVHQFGTKRPTQNRWMLLTILLIFTSLSIVLGTIGEYHRFASGLVIDVEPVTDKAIPVKIEPGAESQQQTLPGVFGMPQKESSIAAEFFSDLVAGRTNAVMPFMLSCWIESLPLLALFLLVPKCRR